MVKLNKTKREALYEAIRTKEIPLERRVLKKFAEDFLKMCIDGSQAEYWGEQAYKDELKEKRLKRYKKENEIIKIWNSKGVKEKEDLTNEKEAEMLFKIFKGGLSA